MAELTTSERLQPSLLDRLTDDHPEVVHESRERRVMSMRQLRAAVLRDLRWLLNTPAKPRFEATHEFPLVQRSVVNYGVPDLTGLTSSGLTPGQLENMVTVAINWFEPRIIRETLSVRAAVTKDEWGDEADQRFEFEISGDFCPLPMPEALFVRTQVDLETGRCEITERS
jgi:type VI secretion system protein ImpF